MLHDAEARHFQPGLQFFQRAAVTLKKQVQEEATRRVSKRLEYVVVVRHRSTIGRQYGHLSTRMGAFPDFARLALAIGGPFPSSG